MGLRIGTWNLERPAARSWKKVPRQRERLAALNVDVWVLTETRASISPGEGYAAVHAPVLHRWSRDDDERMISIWSRWPIEPGPVAPDPRSEVSAIVHSPGGTLLVSGVVIPWANDKGPDGDARMWQQHAETIPDLGRRWRGLRDAYPDAPLVVAGDFNQDRDGSGWYGTHQVRQLLTGELDATGLRLLTGQDVVATGLLERQHLVDHIAVSDPLPAGDAWDLQVMKTTDDDGVRLSDHPTVVVDMGSSSVTASSGADLDAEQTEATVHASSSHEHQSAEAVILDHVADRYGLDDLAPARLELDGVRVELDGWSESTNTAVEVYARVTKPKGGAVKKPMDDAMRLILVRRHHADARLVLAFATDEVADTFRRGRGWRAAALAAAGVEVVSAGISGSLLDELLAATERQYR